MNLLVCALVERFRAMKSGKTRSLDPGGTDIQMAIDFTKLPSQPQPVTRKELAVYGVRLSSQGLLDLIDCDEVTATITDSDTGDQGVFGWRTASEVPETSQTIIEELTDDDVDGDSFEELVAPSPQTSETSASAQLLTQLAASATQLTQTASTQEATPSIASEETTNHPPRRKARISKPNRETLITADNDSGSQTQNQPTHAEASRAEQRENTVVSPSTDVNIGFDVQNRGTGPQQAQSISDRDRATGILVDFLKRSHVVNAVDKVTVMWETGDIIANPIFKWFVERPTAGYPLFDLLREEISHLLEHAEITGVHDLQYGIIQQMTEMDLVWWVFNALIKNETQLYAVPQSAAIPTEDIPFGEMAFISREAGKSYVSFRGNQILMLTSCSDLPCYQCR